MKYDDVVKITDGYKREDLFTIWVNTNEGIISVTGHNFRWTPNLRYSFSLEPENDNHLNGKRFSLDVGKDVVSPQGRIYTEYEEISLPCFALVGIQPYEELPGVYQ